MRLAALRTPRRAARIARALWIAWAVVAWNVVFDHAVVTTGRLYVAAAARAAAFPQPRYENMDAWMQPAVTRGLWLASLVALLILGAGLPLVGAAARRAPAR
jgi:hypothetical protein